MMRKAIRNRWLNKRITGAVFSATLEAMKLRPQKPFPMIAAVIAFFSVIVTLFISVPVC